MLRTNSKKAREAVRDYVTRNTYGAATFDEAAALIRDAWRRYERFGARRPQSQEAFREFASCLPLDTFDYIARGDTVQLVGDMLEETEAERSRYSDSQACDLLTYLIFREISASK